MYRGESSLVNDFNDLLECPDLKSVYSFGHNSSESFEYGKETAEFSPLRRESSAFLKFDSQIQCLGIEVLRTSEKSYFENLDVCNFCHCNEEKMKCMSLKVKETQTKMINILKELKNLKEISEKIIKENNYLKFFEEISQQILKKTLEKKERFLHVGSPKSQKEEDKLMKSYESTENSFDSYLNSPHLTVAKEFKTETQKVNFLHNLTDEGFLKQTVNLQRELMSKSEEIKLLKSQITALEKLNENKEGYFNEKLKAKEFELSQKFGLSTNNINLSRKRRNSEHSEISPFHKISPKNNQSSFPMSHRNSIEVSLILDGKRSSMEEAASDPKIQIKNRNDKMDTHLMDKFQISSHSRKSSTDYSFERVSEKLKRIKTSMKEEIIKLSN